MPRRQRDESFTRFEKKPESIPFTPSDTTDAISYGYSFDARDDGAGSWVSDGSATRRVLADKKAGTTTIGPDLERTAHRAKGRNVANADGSTAWVAGPDAVDLDPGSDVVGTPDARDYTDWWSDPPCYGE
ncbi:MAG: hypothetical protein JW889_07205 [Verrucomicrobia bacterium]|nr:hypothetical protein [Verrucomicrobiota bacterium]